MPVRAEKAVLGRVRFGRQPRKAKVTAHVVQAGPRHLTGTACETVERAASTPVLVADSTLVRVVAQLAQ